MLPNEIIFVSGRRGSGKSYWTKQHARKLPRCLIFDSLGEYQTDHRFYELEDLVEFLKADQNDPQFFHAAYDTHLMDEDFPMFCRAVLARGDLYLIIEEIDLYCRPIQTVPEFKKLLKYGRHYGIQIIGVSRRPAEVSRDFTSAATRFISFHTHEPIDIKYFRSIYGRHAEQLATIPQFHYMDVNMELTDPDFSIKSPI